MARVGQSVLGRFPTAALKSACRRTSPASAPWRRPAKIPRSPSPVRESPLTASAKAPNDRAGGHPSRKVGAVATSPHLPRDPRAADLLFDAGMAMLVSAQAAPPSEAAVREALLDASITLFRAILVEHPDFVRVRLELARAFFLRGRDGLP